MPDVLPAAFCCAAPLVPVWPGVADCAAEGLVEVPVCAGVFDCALDGFDDVPLVLPALFVVVPEPVFEPLPDAVLGLVEPLALLGVEVLLLSEALLLASEEPVEGFCAVVEDGPDPELLPVADCPLEDDGDDWLWVEGVAPVLVLSVGLSLDCVVEVESDLRLVS
ncbi:MAG: hypothetical protein JO245_09150 [Pseudolabrys sp.]|nr:hypothetical protein [Pseudolabrys sp.]